MIVEELAWEEATGWGKAGKIGDTAGLVLYFGATATLADGARHAELCEAFPRAQVIGCSTGGQIDTHGLTDTRVTAVALRFEDTPLRLATVCIDHADDSRACGATLGRHLSAPDLAGVFMLSDGLHVNGSELVAGISAALPAGVPVTGGLAGDGPDFRRTLVGAGTMPPAERRIAAVGFYGPAIRFGHGCGGGWDTFGPRRRISGAKGNVLHMLDDEPALDLYERYLGDEAAGLPGTALLFPLRIWDPARPEHDIVRTVLGIDREKRTMTFAGDVPEGWYAQLMHGRFGRLTQGAAEAAGSSAPAPGMAGDSLALLVSCIGRRLLMGQHIEDEIEAVAERLALAGVSRRLGFYSYGEIGPHHVSGRCELMNQTMAVTTIAEVARA
ncbi:MAG: FIST N-terminal domain-containing protein [Pseudomonadota bacterium]